MNPTRSQVCFPPTLARSESRCAAHRINHTISGLVGLFLATCTALAQPAPASPGSIPKEPEAGVISGTLGQAQRATGRRVEAATETRDLGDAYLRRVGEEIRLLRATREAALVIGPTTDARTAIEAATARAGVRGLRDGEFARLGGGRQVVVVVQPGSAAGVEPDRAKLRAVEGVLAVQSVLIDPESKARMIPTGELIVGLKPGVAVADVEADLKRSGLEVVERIGSPRLNSYLVRLTDPTGNSLALARELFRHPRIDWATPNFVRELQLHFTPSDPLFPQQQHLHNTGQQGGTVDADVDAVEAWDVTRGTNKVVIAIIDDGVDTTHPDLSIYYNPGESGGGKETNGIDDDGNGKIDDFRGWDFANFDNNPNPVGSNGHGTACAGVAAGMINNGYRTTGIAGECRIFPVKIFADSGVATSDANIGAAISYAADFADILSNSWGGGSPSAFIDAAIVDAVTNGRGGKGCPIFFATGNSATIWGKAVFPVGANLGAGTFSFGFRYQKDFILAAGEDLVKIDNVVLVDGDSYTHVNSALGTSGRQDFEGVFPPAGWSLSSSGGANWATTGAGAFSGTAGASSARSGVTADLGWCELRSPNVTLAGDETLNVQLYVSSEYGFDGLVLRVYNSTGTFIGNYGLISGVYSAYTPVSYPANHPDALSVGASTDCDRRSDYSEYGPETDFVAPSNGGWNDITTLDPTGAVGYSSTDYTPSFGGTSSATPLAAGIGALVLSVNSNLTAIQVRDALRNTADKIGPLPYVGGFNNEYGYGRLNAKAAVDAVSTAVVTLVASDPSAAEPADSGTFTFTRTGSTAAPLTVNFTVGGTATSGSDYTSLGTSITFQPGWIITNLVVHPIDDIDPESTETVLLNLASGPGYTIGSPSSDTVHIADNDSAFLTVDNADGPSRVLISGAWGTSTGLPGYWGINYLHDQNAGKGTKSVTFIPTVATPGSYEAFIWYTADVNRASNVPVDVIHGGGTTTKTVNQRINGGTWVSLGTFTFASGTAGRVVVRTTATDGYVIADAIRLVPAVVTPTVTVTASDPSAGEPSDSGTFTFTRTGSTASPLTVNFTVGGTATSGSDYTSLGTSITFLAGWNITNLVVNPIDDSDPESTETVNLSLTAGPGYNLGSPSSGTVNIADNDTAFLTVDNADGPSHVLIAGAWTPATVAPGYWGTDYLQDQNAGKGTKSVTFIPTVATPGSYEVFVWYTAHANRASNVPIDVLHGGGTTTVLVNQRISGSSWVSLGVYTFASGTAGRVVVRTTATDGYVIADAIRLVPAVVTPNVTVTASDPSAGEPADSGTFTFTRTGSTASPLTVNFTVGGTATSGSDYTSLGTSITFQPGWNITNLVVNPIDDSDPESTETVLLNLASGPGYNLGSPSSGTVNIADNDTAAFLTVDNADGPSRVLISGAWTAASLAPGYWGTDYLQDQNAGKGTKSVTLIPTVATAGSYEVFVWYTAHANRASNVPIDVIHSGGTTTRTVNQRLNGSSWVSLGTFTFASGTAGRVIIRTTATDGYVIADAIRLVPVSAFLTVDNADGPSRVLISGAWTAATVAPTYWGTDYLHDQNADKGTKSVTFIPTVATPGSHEVFIWYTAAANRATNVPVDIIHSGGTKVTNINQRINGSTWVSLGTYSFASGTAGRVVIRTTGTSTGYVIADAIRLVAVAGPALAMEHAALDSSLSSASPELVIRQEPDVTVTLTGEAGIEYLVEASADLVTWIPIGSISGTGEPVTFVDPDAEANPHRFYRVLQQTLEIRQLPAVDSNPVQ